VNGEKIICGFGHNSGIDAIKPLKLSKSFKSFTKEKL
jgi:hypothetical protein